MPQLLPHLLLRCRTELASNSAIVLRAGGYAVTKAGDDELALQVVAAGHVDGVVIELPMLHSIRFARLLDELDPAVPVLIVTSWSEALRKALPDMPLLPAEEIEDELVCAVDRILADYEIALWQGQHGQQASAGRS